MTRVKKTRKTGPLAPAKQPQNDWEKPKGKTVPPKTTQKTKGHKPGSRSNPVTGSPKGSAKTEANALNDPRHGSKKPITLIDPAQQHVQQVKQPAFDRKAALAELSALENDQRLEQLLDRVDAGETLSKAEAAYVEERTERFAQLADLLGIDLDDDDDFDDEGDDARD